MMIAAKSYFFPKITLFVELKSIKNLLQERDQKELQFSDTLYSQKFHIFIEIKSRFSIFFLIPKYHHLRRKYAKV